MQKDIVIKNDLHDEIDYILSELNNIENIDICVSKSKLFTKISLDFEPEKLYQVKECVVELLLLSKKVKYIMKGINVNKMTYPLMCLLSALTYFEYEEERSIVLKLIANTKTYSIDGIYEFAMQSVKENWDEIIELTTSLLNTDYSEVDIYNVATFMMSPRLKENKSLFLADIENLLITNVSEGGVLKIKTLFEEPSANLIATIIGESPSEVLVDSDNSNSGLIKCLKNIVKVKII